MAKIPAQGGGAAGGAGGGPYEAVEFVPIRGSSSIQIGGSQLPGTVEIEQTGGVNAPTKRTESGYDYTTRVNREAREATLTGWVDGDFLAGLKILRNKQEPFAVVGGVVIIARATLEDLQETQSGDYRAGAVKVSVDVKEAFQAKAGTSNVRAFGSTGPKDGSGGLFGDWL